MAYDVFISYSSHDLERVQYVQRALQSNGVHIFIAEYSVPAGTPLTPAIVQAIKQCDLFILLWSRSSQVSPWVHEEIGMARVQEKPIIPLVLDDAIPLPDLIRELKYLPVHRDPEQSIAWLQQHVTQSATSKQIGQVVAVVGLAALVIGLLSSGGKGS